MFGLVLYFISQWSHHFKELATTYAEFYTQKQGKNKLNKSTCHVFGHWDVCPESCERCWGGGGNGRPQNGDVGTFLLEYNQVPYWT